MMNEVGTSTTKTIEISNWIIKVLNAVNRLQEEMKQPVTKIRHARLLAVSIILREFPDEEERKLLNQWEKTSFRIFGLCRKDARTGVGDFVRLAREIHKKDLSPNDISESIRKIGAGYTIDEASDQLWDADCYTKWKDELRYLLYRYEEHLAEQRGESLSIQQWNQIWKESAVDSIEHILPQSKGSQYPSQTSIFVHRLGNLLLLPPRLNSTLGGKDPEAKAEAYHGTRLHIAEEVAETIQSDGWDKPEITNREAEIIDWVLEEYNC
ncbi:HNH endonuclease [Candidatus Poribacteria bacterium]|nr:HNH endonuclease [Candidatus Poribacteria bacterium]